MTDSAQQRRQLTNPRTIKHLQSTEGEDAIRSWFEAALVAKTWRLTAEQLARQVARSREKVAALPKPVRDEPVIADLLKGQEVLMKKIDQMSEESKSAGQRQLWHGLMLGAVIGVPFGLLTNWLFVLIAG